MGHDVNGSGGLSKASVCACVHQSDLSHIVGKILQQVENRGAGREWRQVQDMDTLSAAQGHWRCSAHASSRAHDFTGRAAVISTTAARLQDRSNVCTCTSCPCESIATFDFGTRVLVEEQHGLAAWSRHGGLNREGDGDFHVFPTIRREAHSRHAAR